MIKREKLNIVMFNMSRYSDWQKGIANRNYHILHNLVKHDEINKVIAVDFLPFNWKRAVKTLINDQLINDTRGAIIYGDLTSRCWQITSKIFVYSTIDNLLKPARQIRELNRIINEQEMMENLIVWNYNPLYVDYFGQLNQNLNIFDTVDDWLTHSSYQKYKKILKINYQEIQAKSDLIFTVSQSLQQGLFQGVGHAYWLPNAVDLEFFQAETKVSAKLTNLPQPIIGFLGILQDRIDTDILLNLAKKNPDKTIVLAGPVWPEFPKKQFERFKNVHFLGPIHHQEIPSLYNGFSVGIIPYKINHFIKSTDPMKFYEYLAAKLPIVSTKVAGLDRFKELIQVAHNPEQFDDLINQALAESKDEFSQEKLKLLQSNTWQYRINQMLDLIYPRL